MSLFDQKIRPMLAKNAAIFDSPDYIFEPKWDGFRCLAFIKNGMRLQSRNLLDITYKFPEIRPEINAESAILDGELVCIEKGAPSFNKIQQRNIEDIFKIEVLSRENPVTYVIFDILFLDGSEVVDLPLIERKELIKDCVIEKKNIKITPYIKEKGKKFLNEAIKLGFEGIIAKEMRSPYLIGKRSDLWLKIKKTRTVDCIVCGYSKGKGNRASSFGSLVLALYEGNELRYIGKVGTGFNHAKLVDTYKILQKLRTDERIFKDIDLKDVEWVKPQLVAEIKYSERTKDNKLRMPVFLRFRLDKQPKECTIDQLDE
ncbi:MAG: non-homologous end-joining DNA ligase [Candidatus Hydrothermarchaeota archaeon]